MLNSFCFVYYSEDNNWIVAQAKRKREKDDIFVQNPSFDPIFMKV